MKPGERVAVGSPPSRKGSLRRRRRRRRGSPQGPGVIAKKGWSK